MSAVFTDAVGAVAAFAAETAISDRARQRASTAVIDTCGVMLAGTGETAARIAQSLAADEGAGECRVVGTSITTGAALAAFANGVAAHALDTFSPESIRKADVQALMPRVTLRANPAFDTAAPLSQARVTVRLRDGREWSQHADGARGYPGRLTEEELSAKFEDCAARALGHAEAKSAWNALTSWLTSNEQADVRTLTAHLSACVA
jgi:2-methylcitrate dehydratase PrpD